MNTPHHPIKVAPERLECEECSQTYLTAHMHNVNGAWLCDICAEIAARPYIKRRQAKSMRQSDDE